MTGVDTSEAHDFTHQPFPSVHDDITFFDLPTETISESFEATVTPQPDHISPVLFTPEPNWWEPLQGNKNLGQLGLQEACLVRCFVAKLARAVSLVSGILCYMGCTDF